MEIVHYFAPMSGYAYLGIGRLRKMAERYDCPVRHAPVDIQKVFAASGVTPPAAQSPGRKAYRIADMQRWANRLDLPLNPTPRFWPVAGALAAQAILAADVLFHRGGDLSEAILAAVWARDLDISDPSVIARLAQEIGLDAQALGDAAGGADVIASAEVLTKKAVDLQLFGSPTYVLGAEIFFGQDRLDFLEDALRQGKTGAGLA